MLGHAVAAEHAQCFGISIGFRTDHDHVRDQCLRHCMKILGYPIGTAMCKEHRLQSFFGYLTVRWDKRSEPVDEHREQISEIAAPYLAPAADSLGCGFIDEPLAFGESSPGPLDISPGGGKHSIHFGSTERLALSSVPVFPGKGVERQLEVRLYKEWT